MTKLKLYNTLTRKLEEFKPLHPPKVTMYTCGPTVYDFAHIGHARTYVFADLLRRVLLYNGYKMEQVMNITDVGHLTEADTLDEGQDKIEMAAERQKKTVWNIARFYTDDFFKMVDELNILRPSIVCKATDHIKEQIELVKRIEKEGFAYVIDRGVCFDTSKFPGYADFARLDLKGLRKGSRIEFDSQKKNPTDFWLWRFSDPKEKRQMEWESPWGKGYPGWHIECSAMGMKYLGERFDIHTGGIDHIPVHHTNEIAQNWVATGHKVVNYWLHGEHLTIEGEKMAKSLKNFYRVVDLKNRGFEPLALRYLFLTAHYRARLNFTWESLEAAQKALKHLRAEVRSLQGKGQSLKDSPADYRQRFLAAINNDLDTPRALAVVWEMVKNQNLKSKYKKKLILDFDQVLGLGLAEVRSLKISRKVKELLVKRDKLRKQGKWAEADKIRTQVKKLGFEIEDTEEGPKVMTND
jgi:cysteinyl-tRNA synthetase